LFHALVSYLEDWQKRMVKDFLGVDCHTYEVPVEDPVVLKYGVPTHHDSKRMYFTGWQIREMRDETGVVCDFVELHKDIIHILYAYGMPTE
jgi:hypothetical protein